jgi:hypothetical protein
MRRLSRLLSCVLLLAGCGRFAPDRIAAVPAGFASHQLCGGVFLSGQDADRYWGRTAPPDLAFLQPLLVAQIDRAAGEVRTRFAGLGARRDVLRGEAGCLTLPPGQAAPPPPALPPFGAPLLEGFLPEAGSVAAPHPAWQAALDAGFDAPELARETSAVVIVHRGRVVAERYGPGFGPDRRVEGWSATKTVTNALLGILVQQGRLAMDAPAPVAAWAAPGDPRAAITPAQLLRMTSGLDFGQSLFVGLGDLVNPPTQMLYSGADMGALAAAAPLAAPPGTRFRYTNGDTMILARIIRDRVGGDEAAALGFARTALFGPLGMRSAVLQTDAAGSPMGADGAWATPRDWARLGLLYARDGVLGGRRLLPAGWVAWSAIETPGSGMAGYGAGMWTNRGDGPGARHRIAAGMPAEAFMARGAFGQYVVAIPSRDLVIARFGQSHDPRNRVESVARIVAAALRAQDAAP